MVKEIDLGQTKEPGLVERIIISREGTDKTALTMHYLEKYIQYTTKLYLYYKIYFKYL